MKTETQQQQQQQQPSKNFLPDLIFAIADLIRALHEAGII